MYRVALLYRRNQPDNSRDQGDAKGSTISTLGAFLGFGRTTFRLGTFRFCPGGLVLTVFFFVSCERVGGVFTSGCDDFFGACAVDDGA